MMSLGATERRTEGGRWPLQVVLWTPLTRSATHAIPAIDEKKKSGKLGGSQGPFHFRHSKNVCLLLNRNPLSPCMPDQTEVPASQTEALQMEVRTTPSAFTAPSGFSTRVHRDLRSSELDMDKATPNPHYSTSEYYRYHLPKRRTDKGCLVEWTVTGFSLVQREVKKSPFFSKDSRRVHKWRSDFHFHGFPEWAVLGEDGFE